MKRYRLTESRLRGMIREAVKSVLLEGKQWVGEFDNNNFDRLQMLATQREDSFSFSLNSMDFTISPGQKRWAGWNNESPTTSNGFRLTCDTTNFAYNTSSVEEALKIAWQYSNDALNNRQ